MFEGKGNDGDIEPGLLYVEDSEADAVEADRAFFYHEPAEFFGEFETKLPAAVEVLAIEAGGGCVDMALNDMAVEPAVHNQASFEVDEVAGLPLAKVAFFEGFFDGRYAVEVVFLFFHGEADAVMGDTLIDFEFAGDGGGYPECLVSTFAFYGVDPAKGFDDAGKHGR